MDLTINMVNHNFTLTHGDSLSFNITFEDAEIAPNDIIFAVKDNCNSSDAVISKSLNDGTITRTQDSGYVYNIYIPYYDTDDLELLNYIYQIEVIFGSDHETCVEGKLIITPEV